MNTMDRKIAARRHGVSEQRATARLKLEGANACTYIPHN